MIKLEPQVSLKIITFLNLNFERKAWIWEPERLTSSKGKTSSEFWIFVNLIIFKPVSWCLGTWLIFFMLRLSDQHYFSTSWYPWKMHELIELWHQKRIPFSFLLSLALFLFSSHLFLLLLFFPPHYSLGDFPVNRSSLSNRVALCFHVLRIQRSSSFSFHLWIALCSSKSTNPGSDSAPNQVSRN